MKNYFRNNFKKFSQTTITVFLLLLFSFPAESQLYSENQLINYGIEYYKQMQYLKASLFLFAYIQKQPDLMQNPKFAKEVQDAYIHSLNQAQLQSEQESEGIRTATSAPEIPEIPDPEEIRIQSYKLILRGGKDVYFDYNSNLPHKPQIRIKFKRSSNAAGQNLENWNKLLPGEAAWIDRPISKDEPERLLINVDRFAMSWYNREIAGIISELSYLQSLMDSDRFVTFHVYNDENGNFFVTKVEQ